MKSHRIIFDNYLHGYQKFIVFYLLIITLFGCLNFLLKPNNLTDFLIGLLLLIISYILLVAMIGKKGLLISNGNFYRGLTISGKFLLKEKIDIEKYSEFTHERQQKTDLPWIFEYSGLGLFSNHHECSVYLSKSNSKKRKILSSFSDYEMYYDVRRFLERWTELKEEDKAE